MNTLDPKQSNPVLWGTCRYCRAPLLQEDLYCWACGRQRDYAEHIP